MIQYQYGREWEKRSASKNVHSMIVSSTPADALQIWFYLNLPWTSCERIEEQREKSLGLSAEKKPRETMKTADRVLNIEITGFKRDFRVLLRSGFSARFLKIIRVMRSDVFFLHLFEYIWKFHLRIEGKNDDVRSNRLSKLQFYKWNDQTRENKGSQTS